MQGEKVLRARSFRRLMSGLLGIDARFAVRRGAARRLVG
jgi:hypothetical protein